MGVALRVCLVLVPVPVPVLRMSSYLVVDEPAKEAKTRRQKAPLFFDVDKEETKGAFRASVLFVLAAIVVLAVDLSVVRKMRTLPLCTRPGSDLCCAREGSTSVD